MGKMCSCGGCHVFTKHYARGLCRNCYSTLLRNEFTDIKQLVAYKKGRQDYHATVKAKRDAMTERRREVKATSSNEFTFAPRSTISQQIFNWYYYSADKYLIFECNNDERLRKNVYNTAYGMTKRRHHLNIKRHQRNKNIILERVSA